MIDTPRRRALRHSLRRLGVSIGPVVAILAFAAALAILAALAGLLAGPLLIDLLLTIRER